MTIGTYHIQISGLVQGVGFRPFVSRMAAAAGLCGEVYNSTEGVHILFNATEAGASAFYTAVISQPPANARVLHHQLYRVADRVFDTFSITPSTVGSGMQVLLPPDVALCANCRQELNDVGNRRYQYAFTTCTDCGPRYSIITALPFDREHTTMAPLATCSTCQQEYLSIQHRRHHSQTNSCPDCTIPMELHCFETGNILHDAGTLLPVAGEKLAQGKIVAVKGVGGYLLLCDAANAASIQLLRARKHRPQKPFALLCADREQAVAVVRLREEEAGILQSPAAPILLLPLLTTAGNRICCEGIAPGLDTLGVMLPATPLLQLIAGQFANPLVATSANTTGSPILYRDQDALQGLRGIADLVLTCDRDIVVPQDDSVLRVSALGQKIVVRRSRGYAPGYFPAPFEMPGHALLAMGGELKSAFAILSANQLYVSQYLGDQGSYEAQQAYTATLDHLCRLLHFTPRQVLVDMHPGYQVSAFGRHLAAAKQVPVIPVQHHKAHFAAVLAENHLLQTNEPVLGIIWDGAGYGEDGQVWGGEVFLLHKGVMNRVAHLGYFKQLLGDKMSREPRLSALSLLSGLPQQRQRLQKYFTADEWPYYCRLLSNEAVVNTSSMGRLLDGIATMLGITTFNTYEGEAAMKLEVLANTAANLPLDHYRIPIVGQVLQWQELIVRILEDLDSQVPTHHIARKVYASLATLIINLAACYSVKKVACSGGVFQSSLLTDMITEMSAGKLDCYFHRQLSPNDECIGFGQIACYQLDLLAKARGQQKEIPINF